MKYNILVDAHSKDEWHSIVEKCEKFGLKIIDTSDYLDLIYGETNDSTIIEKIKLLKGVVLIEEVRVIYRLPL